jgi:DNA-binding transcriptional regulator WhiA
VEVAWSYTRQVKAELARYPLQEKDKAWAELWGLRGLLTAPQVQEPWLSTRSALVARRAFRVIKQAGLHPQIRAAHHQQRLRFDLFVAEGTVADPAAVVPAHGPDFVRGAFISRGYVSAQERAAHWEVIARSTAWCEAIVAALADAGIKARATVRRRVSLVYLKDWEQIAQVFALIGAHQAMLRLESWRVEKSLKNQINRLVNSETANVKRAVESGLEDRALLYRWERRQSLTALPDDLQEVAWLRFLHPDWTLTDLGRHLTPPLSKSAVNHRLRRLRRWLLRQLEN